MKKLEKFLLESSVLLTVVSVKAKKAGKSLKEYFYEPETIKHISLVLYDLLPLSVKIGMRYEKFHEIFERNFKAIRNALLGEEVREIKEVVVIKEVNVTKPEKVAKKTPKKKITEKALEEQKPSEVKKAVKRVRKLPVNKNIVSPTKKLKEDK